VTLEGKALIRFVCLLRQGSLKVHHRQIVFFKQRLHRLEEIVRALPVKRLIEAVRKDRENISYEKMQINEYGNLVTVELNYTTTYVSAEGKEFQVEQSDSYSIGKYDVNTWALLEELNLFADKRMITVQDVKSVDVYADEYISYEVSEIPEGVAYAASAANMERVTVVRDYDYKKYSGNNKNFSDPADIEVLYNLYTSYHNNVLPVSEDCIVLTLGLNMSDNSTRSRQLIMPVRELPEILRFIEQFYAER